MKTIRSISDYLIQQLGAHGVDHVFGIPGDYSLSFYNELERSELQMINTCDEQGAGFAADAYARTCGLGAVCITYCVGGLKVANTTAQAFAEKSPVVVISGAPGIGERTQDALLHHMVRDFNSQFKIFQELTAASTILDNAENASSEIDRVIGAALQHKRPVYIELPRDMVAAPYRPSRPAATAEEVRDLAARNERIRNEVLEEALEEAVQRIEAAQRPVIIAGVELQRLELQDTLLQFVAHTNIPFTATPLSKSVVSERHPRYLGVYEGALGAKATREYVESSDCLILLGVLMTDLNLGLFTAKLDLGHAINVTSEKTSIQHHHYEGIHLPDFVWGLSQANIGRRAGSEIPHPEPPLSFYPTNKPVTVQRLFQRLNSFIDDNTVVIADTGDAMFGAAEMSVYHRTEFLSSAYYASLGFAVPASIGVQLARPELRSLVLVGDGAFQMTGMELSTVARYKLNPIVVVFNNGGYGTERPMLDGPFNDIPLWQYSRIPELLGAGMGFDVKTEQQLEAALLAARDHTDEYCILDVHLDPHDISPALQRLTATLAERVR